MLFFRVIPSWLSVNLDCEKSNAVSDNEEFVSIARYNMINFP